MTIHKKLLRDLIEHKGANLAAIIVIAIGIMIFNGAAKTMDDLYISKEIFYKECIFPDAYASVIAAPTKFKNSFEKINSVKLLEGRMSEDVKVLNTNKSLRLISKTQHLGKYTILEGKEPDDSRYEILLGNKFADANNYKIGDTISIISKGNVTKLKICGIARSAENIYIMKDETAIFSDPKEFGIAFMDLTIMKSITGNNYFDEILFQLENGVEFKDIKNDIYKQLENYGVISLYSRDDQPSNIVFEGELKELKTTMIFMPTIFLMVAALVMSIMIKRIISQQRGQIGILKAFGYSDLSVAIHYASYCIVIGIFGGILGSIFGTFFSNVFLGLYKDFFNMEFLEKYSAYNYYLNGILLSSFFCAVTGIWSSQKAMVIQPAEAMRQEAPQSGQRSILEKYSFFDTIFDSKGKMAIRNIVRNRRRSTFIIIGLSFAFAISIIPFNMLSMMDDMIFDRFKYVEKYDAKVVSNGLIQKDPVKRELQSFSGVNHSESMLSIPAKLKHHGIIEDIQVIGLDKNSTLYSIVDNKNQAIKISSSGIVLSVRLAEKLGVKVGDNVIFKSPYSKYKKDETKLKVDSIVLQTIGMNGYMNIDFLSKTLGYKPVCNNILLKTDNQQTIKDINKKYEDSQRVKAVQSQQEAIDQIKERMGAMYSSMFFMAFIAMVMSFAIIYNIYLVVILERKREFSTLMVLGMSEKKVLSIISFEQWISATAGMIIGIPIAKSLIVIMSKGLSTDMFTMPTSLEIGAVLIAVILMGISILIAQLLASKKINKIDIVDALKSGE